MAPSVLYCTVQSQPAGLSSSAFVPSDSSSFSLFVIVGGLSTRNVFYVQNLESLMICLASKNRRITQPDAVRLEEPEANSHLYHWKQ